MPTKSTLSLRGLRTFCIAARYGSFRTAGEELFVTASAVSHQIKSLEEELGQQLFDRNSRELRLTEIGRLLYSEVGPLIEQLDEIAATYKKGGSGRSIRISVQPFFASEFFIPRLSEFTAEHPEIDIQVGTSDESTEKHPNDADMSIRLFRSPPMDMPTNRLFPLCMQPAGSAEFKRSIKVRKKRIVSEFPLIVHESRPKSWSEWSESSGIELPQDAKITRLDSMIAVVRAAQRGLGAALVPVPVGELWFTEGSIVPLFDEQLVADVSYFLVTRDDRANDKSVERLREWIVTRFQSQG